MVYQRGYVLEYDREVGAQVRILGTGLALEQVGHQALLVDYVLAHVHRILLELVDVQQEVLVDILLLVYALAETGHVLGNQLHDIGVEVDALVHDRHEDRKAVGILVGTRLYL